MFGCAWGRRGSGLAVLGLLGLLPCAARGVQPGQRFDQYAHAAWPSVAHASTIYSLLTDREGSLWVGTSEGVVRFDGSRVTTFDPARLPGIVDRDVRALFQTADGTMWIGSGGRGLSRVSGDRLVPWSIAGDAGSGAGPAGGWVYDVFQAGDGTVWVGGRAGLMRFAPGAAQAAPAGEGLPQRCTHVLVEQRQPSGPVLWAGTHGGLARWDGQRWRPEAGPAGAASPAPGIDALLVDAAGTLWAGTRGDGLWQLHDGRWTRLSTEAGLGSKQVTAMLQDRAGRLWVATRDGHLAWRDGDRFRAFPLPPELCGDRIEALAEDREGGLWIGTDRCGLHRLADRPFQRLTTADGLPSDAVLGLHLGPGGEVVVGTRGAGLVGQAAGGGPFQPLACAAGLPCHECWDFSAVRSPAAPGGFWTVCRQNVVLRWDGGTMARLSPLPGGLAAASFVLEASDGAVWFTLGDKVVRRHGQQHSLLPEQEHFQGYRILFEGKAGHVWISADDGLTRWKDGRSQLVRLPPTERPAEVANLHQHRQHDDETTLWMATKGEGIRLLRGGRIRTIGVGQGLPTGWIVQLLEDGQGRLWASSSKGIFWVARRELEEVAQGRRLRVYPSLYDANDGIQIRTESFGHPAGFEDRRGRLWFATNSGIVIVDPAAAAPGPRVEVQQLSLGGQRVDLRPGLVPAVTGMRQDLDVGFHALTFGPADAVSYRYRLEPSGKAWVDLGFSRTLHEPGLSPGGYRLSIAARTRESAWSASPLALEFRVAAPFHRSPAFLVPLGALLALAVGLSLLGLHRLRLGRARAELQTVMAERGRISREIHDTLAQAFVATSVQLECLEEALEAERPGPAPLLDGKIRRHLDTAKKVVEESLDEARRAVWVLRPQAIESGLVPALQKLVERASGGIRVELTVTGNPRELSPLVASNLLRIAHEALANAHRHAGARRIELRLAYAARSVSLAVADDGKGLVSPPAGPRADGDSGQGILGMRERAAQMGGTLSIAGGPERGTTVAVEVAA